MSTPHIDAQLLQLLPHRPPMLLLTKLITVNDRHAKAQALISESSPFYLSGPCMSGSGVPSWVALEIMGQTAALIAGFQEANGLLDSGTGFLLGCRRLQATVPCFPADTLLTATCDQSAVMDGGLATFDCRLTNDASVELATATLSVFRQGSNEQAEFTQAPVSAQATSHTEDTSRNTPVTNQSNSQ